ncbi:MAG: hypothetical protein IKE42_28430 [Aquamicrobium sp.]|nr:hypothetical protein [Aquamicrobium sp.]
MGRLKSFMNWLAGATPKPKPSYDFGSVSKTSRAAVILARQGVVTAWDLQQTLRTTDPRGVISRLRQRGFISRSVERKNATGGRYVMHIWSGKVPTFKTNQ